MVKVKTRILSVNYLEHAQPLCTSCAQRNSSIKLANKHSCNSGKH